jgi:hypothetical protein
MGAPETPERPGPDATLGDDDEQRNRPTEYVSTAAQDESPTVVVEEEEARHGRNLPAEEPAARFTARERPNRYARGIGQDEPTRPCDPIVPYLAPPVARRRRSDWMIMVFALTVSFAVMIAVCVAGFALFKSFGR